MIWTCPSCGTEWPEKPLVDGTIGCPNCGNFAVLAGKVRDRLDRGEEASRLLDARAFKVRPWNAARKELDELLARLSAAETERDQAHKRAEVFRHSLEITALDCGAAEARAEAAEKALREIAGSEPYEDSPTGWMRKVARAALAGREERQ